MERFSGDTLTCVRAGRLVFHELSFAVQAGGCLTLIGRNGAGKSSLLRMMAGLLKPFAGTLLYDGQSREVAEEATGFLSHYIGHHDAVKSTLSVGENLAFWRALQGTGQGAVSVANALDVFGIAHLESVQGRFLSAGQKRRTALARLFVTKAPIWLLDEPTTALDQETIKRLEREIDAHRAQGGMVVLSTHSPLALEDQVILDVSRFTPTEDSLLATEAFL